MRKTHRILVGTALLSTVACESATMGARANQIPSTAIDEIFDDAGVKRLAHSQNNGYDRPVRAVIRDQESWQAAWTKLYIGMSPAPPAPPAVDFSRSAVILVALGARPSGGYDITISRVARDAGVVYVEVTSTSPGDRCGTTLALTRPVDIVAVPHTVDEAVFVERNVVTQC
jgi:hypothetical protein